MAGIEFCQGCGGPLLISRDLRWEANGAVSLSSSRANRMVMFECECIDRIFKGIEELIGLSVEHIVIESRSRETRVFTERSYPLAVRKILEGTGGRKEGQGLDIPPEKKEALLSTMRVMTASLVDTGKIYGYGDQHLGELWDQGADYPWRKLYLNNPYSLLFQAADNLGWVEAFEGSDMWVRYGKVDGARYTTEVYPAQHPIGLQERLQRKKYEYKNGDIKYDRCVECDLPLEVARYKWDADDGTITDPDTGWRVAIFSPASVDGIFDDLQAELGDAIQSTVIEAMRRFTRESWSAEDWNRPAFSFKQMFALRGLGNLVYFDGEQDRLTLIVENMCMPLLMVGMVQALVEMAYGLDESSLEWQAGDDGRLSVTVGPK